MYKTQSNVLVLKDTVFKLIWGVSLMIGLGVGAYGLYLLLIGVRQISLTDSWHTPHPGGYISLLGGGLLVLGLLARRSTITWVGWTVIATFSGLFLFSVGGILIPVSILLLLLLGIMTWIGQPKQRPVSHKVVNTEDAIVTNSYPLNTIFKMSLSATLMLAIAMGAYGLYLLLVGVRQTSPTETWLEPSPIGYFPLVSAGLLMLGLLARKLTITWVGGVMLAMSAVLHLPILGNDFIAMSVLLLLLSLLGIMTWTGKLK